MKEMNEYKAEIFSRMEKGIKERKIIRNRILTFGTSLCLCLLIGLSVWQSGLFDRQPTIITGDNSSETGSSDQINNNQQPNQGEAPKIEGGVKDVEIESFDTAIMRWKEKTISFSLWNALKNATDKDYLSIYLIPRIIYDDLNNANIKFTYEGKNLKEYYDAWENKTELNGKLGTLLKMGDELKYGEALYITGTPDGKKWAKAYYEEMVENIGKDLLEKYIINGEFLLDKVIEDSEKLAVEMRDAEAKYFEACDEYKKFILAEKYQQLKEQGINVGLSSTGNTLMVLVTKSEFENLKFNDAEHWFFTVQKDVSSEADDVEQYTTTN